MDPELDWDLRRRNIRRADRVLADRAVAEFIERRFLKPVASQAWDFFGALRLAREEELKRVERLYGIVSAPLLLQIEDEVRAWGYQKKLTSVEGTAALDQAYDNGLVAALATGIFDGDQGDLRTKIFFAKNVNWTDLQPLSIISQTST